MLDFPGLYLIDILRINALDFVWVLPLTCLVFPESFLMHMILSGYLWEKQYIFKIFKLSQENSSHESNTIAYNQAQ